MPYNRRTMQQWHLIHTKIRQEQCALDNLEKQGYTCFLPMLHIEKPLRGKLCTVLEPLFPRYLFIQLSAARDARSWTPIRSTLGVSRLVTFGQHAAVVDASLIADLQARTQDGKTIQHFSAGQALQITTGPFAGHEAVFTAMDGEARVMVLLQLLSKPVVVKVAVQGVRKLA